MVKDNSCSVQEVYDAYQGLQYSQYKMRLGEWLIYFLEACAFIVVVSFIFYRVLWIAAGLLPLAALYPKNRKKVLIFKRKNELRYQFKDMLYFLASGLSAGKSVEASLADALSGLKGIYPEEDTYILREVQLLLIKAAMNMPLEEALENLATRSDIEDIRNFAEVFRICNKRGGNLIEVIGSTSQIIKEKIEIKMEIENIIMGKKLEQRILAVMPVAMILLLSTAGGNYLEPIYTTLAGRLVMTAAIVLIGVGYFISEKIMEIKV